MDHYINTNALDLASSRVANLLSPNQSKNFPVLAYGDNSLHRFFFHNDGTIESWSGSASYGLRVTLGEPVNGPDSGSFTLTFGANSTLALPLPVAATDIATALNGLASIQAAGGVTVSGTFPNFIVVFNAVGAQGALTANAALLVPESSVVVTVLTSGDGTHSQKVALVLTQNVIQQTSTFATITSPYTGWSGVLNTNTAACLALLLESGILAGDTLEVETLCTIEVIQTDGTFITYYQGPVLIRAKANGLPGSAPSPGQTIQGFQGVCTPGASTDSFSFASPYQTACSALSAPVIVPPGGGDYINAYLSAFTKTGFSVTYGEPIPAAGTYKIMLIATGS